MMHVIGLFLLRRYADIFAIAAAIGVIFFAIADAMLWSLAPIRQRHTLVFSSFLFTLPLRYVIF